MLLGSEKKLHPKQRSLWRQLPPPILQASEIQTTVDTRPITSFKETVADLLRVDSKGSAANQNQNANLNPNTNIDSKTPDEKAKISEEEHTPPKRVFYSFLDFAEEAPANLFLNQSTVSATGENSDENDEIDRKHIDEKMQSESAEEEDKNNNENAKEEDEFNRNERGSETSKSALTFDEDSDDEESFELNDVLYSRNNFSPKELCYFNYRIYTRRIDDFNFLLEEQWPIKVSLMKALEKPDAKLNEEETKLKAYLDKEQKEIKKSLDFLLEQEPANRWLTPILIQDSNNELWIYGYGIEENNDSQTKLVRYTDEYPIKRQIVFDSFDIKLLNLFLKSQEAELYNYTNTRTAFDTKNRLMRIYQEIGRQQIVPFSEVVDLWEDVYKVTPSDKIPIKLQEEIPALMALCRRNPILESLLWSLDLRVCVEQFFRLYPVLHAKYVPLFISLGIGGGIAGVGLGTVALKRPNILWHPTSKSAFRIRLLWALRNGLTTFIGLMGLAMAIDLQINPSHTHNNSDADSELRFWSSISFAPAAAAGSLVVWQAVSPFTKYKYFHSWLEQIAECFFFDLMFNHSVFSIFLHNTCGMDLWPAEKYALGAAGGTALIKTGLSIKNRSTAQIPSTAILYFLGGSSLYRIIHELISPLSINAVPYFGAYYGLVLSQNILMGIQIAASLLLIKKYYRNFTVNYAGDVEVESRTIEEGLSLVIRQKEEREQRVKNFKEIIQSNKLYFWPANFLESIDPNAERANEGIRDAIIISNERVGVGDRKNINTKNKDNKNQKRTKTVWFASFIRDSRWVLENPANAGNASNTDKSKKIKKVILDSSEKGRIHFAFFSNKRNRELSMKAFSKLGANGQIKINNANYILLGAIMEEALILAKLPFKPENDEDFVEVSLSGSAAATPRRAAKVSISLTAVGAMEKTEDVKNMQVPLLLSGGPAANPNQQERSGIIISPVSADNKVSADVEANKIIAQPIPIEDSDGRDKSCCRRLPCVIL